MWVVEKPDDGLGLQQMRCVQMQMLCADSLVSWFPGTRVS